MIKSIVERKSFIVSDVYQNPDAARKNAPHFEFSFRGAVEFIGLFEYQGAALSELMGEKALGQEIIGAYVIVFIDGVTDRPLKLFKGDKIEVLYPDPDYFGERRVKVFSPNSGDPVNSVFHTAELLSYEPA